MMALKRGREAKGLPFAYKRGQRSPQMPCLLFLVRPILLSPSLVSSCKKGATATFLFRFSPYKRVTPDDMLDYTFAQGRNTLANYLNSLIPKVHNSAWQVWTAL